MALDHRNALPPGHRLLEFTIDSVLGAGGFGITYLAREDPPLPRKVAIKEYLPPGIAIRDADGETVRPISDEVEDDYYWGLGRFATEAETLVQFTHPNIVPVLRFFEGNDTAYLIMAYQEGASLAAILHDRHRLPEPELMAILGPLLDGIGAVHEAGFLHRDIKPDNIFVREDGSPVLIDFGAARQAMSQRNASLTAIFTPGYTPIEQYETRGNQGPWTDIYALGATAYRAVTGLVLPDAASRASAHLQGTPDPLIPASEAAAGEYPPELLSAIDATLRVRHSERPQSVAELLRLLDGEEPRPAPAQRPGAATAPGRSATGGAGRSRLRGRLGQAAAVVLLLAGLGGGYAVFGDRLIGEDARLADAAARIAAEQEARRAEADAAARIAAANEARQAEDDSAARIAAAEEEASRAEEDSAARIAAANEARRAEEDEAARVAAEAEARRAEEDEAARVAAEAEARRAEEDEAARVAAEEEARRQAEEEARRAEEEAAARIDAVEAAQQAALPDAPFEGGVPQRRSGLEWIGEPSGEPAAPGLQGLAAIFSGATVYFSANVAGSNWVVNNGQWHFLPGGTVNGVLTNNAFITDNDNDRGTWRVEGENLCVKWNRWDGGQELCYRISGSDGRYTASGAPGMLSGSFRVSR